MTVAPGRAYYHLEEHIPEAAVPFARLVFERCFGEGIDVTTGEQVASIGEQCGADPSAITMAIGSDAMRQRFRAAMSGFRGADGSNCCP